MANCINQQMMEQMLTKMEEVFAQMIVNVDAAIVRVFDRMKSDEEIVEPMAFQSDTHQISVDENSESKNSGKSEQPPMIQEHERQDTTHLSYLPSSLTVSRFIPENFYFPSFPLRSVRKNTKNSFSGSTSNLHPLPSWFFTTSILFIFPHFPYHWQLKHSKRKKQQLQSNTVSCYVVGGGYLEKKFEASYKTQNQLEALLNRRDQVINMSTQFGEKYSPQLYAMCIGVGIFSYGFTHIAVTCLDFVKCKIQIDGHNMFDEIPKMKLGSWNIIIVELIDFGNYLEMFRLFLFSRKEFFDCGSCTFGTASIGLQFMMCDVGLYEQVISINGSHLAKGIKPGEDEFFFDFSDPQEVQFNLSIIVVGASGDLAKKKTFPAFFALYYADRLPENFMVFGYAHRLDKRKNCEDKMDQFLKRCFYHSGQYNSEEHFAELYSKKKEKLIGKPLNRLFYLSIPPNIFVDVVRCAILKASSTSGWTRGIVENPIGRDSESSAELTRCLKQFLTEHQICRIDRYLGKELVENLSMLYFSNLVFKLLWSRNYMRNVQLIFFEDFGTEGQGCYFANYGIIRDIMQNHLLQFLALFAMETPVSLDVEDIRNEKVKVLNSVQPLQLEDVIVGQYKGHNKGGRKCPGYTDDSTVPNNSLTHTFAAATLFINNARWDGVFFLMKVGKALHTKRAVMGAQFRHVPGNFYKRNFGIDLDKDAIPGEKRLFIKSDELAAWSPFTPLLKELEEEKYCSKGLPLQEQRTSLSIILLLRTMFDGKFVVVVVEVSYIPSLRTRMLRKGEVLMHAK